MSDLIRREALRTTIRMKMFDTRYDFELAMDVVKAAPAVNSKPVVHGEWETTSYNAFMVRCSKCHCGDHIQLAEKDIFNFCPNCGADMRGGNDDKN